MKKYLAQLAFIIPLLFVAGIAMAAYSFVGPTATPPGNNTDGPLDVSSSNQIKNGDLAVNAFQVVSGSEFAQQASFTGLVNGGTAGATSNTSSTINFGTSSTPVSVNNIGNATVSGNYQSNSLKSGGGLKPLCADPNGTFYLCGASVPPVTGSIYLDITQVNINGTIQLGASLSEAINEPVEVTFFAANPSSPFADYIKNNFTAFAESDADGDNTTIDNGSNPDDSSGDATGIDGTNGTQSGGGGGEASGTGTTTQTSPSGIECKRGNAPSTLGSVEIYPGSLNSWDTVPAPSGCSWSQLQVSIGSYTPHASGEGRPIVAETGGYLPPSQ